MSGSDNREEEEEEEEEAVAAVATRQLTRLFAISGVIESRV